MDVGSKHRLGLDEERVPVAERTSIHESTREYHDVDTGIPESKETQHIACVTRIIIAAILAKYSCTSKGTSKGGHSDVQCSDTTP